MRRRGGSIDGSKPWLGRGRNLLVSFAIAGIAAATPACGETLKQVIETTLKSHPKVLSAASQQRASVQDIAQARAGYFPTVDLNLGKGRESTDTPQTRAAALNNPTLTRGESGLLISQKLFDGKATSSEIDRQTALAGVSSSRLLETREDVAFKTTEVFIEVIKNRHLLKLANDNLRSHLQTQEKVRLRVTGGVSQKTDLQQAMGRVALAKSIASARAGTLRTAEANFQAIVGRPAGELDDPAAKLTETVQSGSVNIAALAQAIKQSSDAAIASSPTLSAANAEIAAADASVRGAKSPYYPRLNLELSANRNSNLSGLTGNYNSEALMLMLRWNLFRGGADQAQERGYVERRFAAIDSAANVRRELEERVAVALHAKATSEERLAYLQEHANLSADVLESYKQQLDLGRRTLLDVLNAENELFTALSNLAVGRYEDLLNYYAIEAAKGLLVSSLGIALAD